VCFLSVGLEHKTSLCSQKTNLTLILNGDSSNVAAALDVGVDDN
jgi:hypothetical protein